MKKIILIINLIVKTIVELVLVCTIGLLTGLIVFIEVLNPPADAFFLN